MAVHQLVLSGCIVDVKTRDKTGGRVSSVLLTVQYGKARSREPGSENQFVNANIIRIPGTLYAKLREQDRVRLVAGEFIDITGHTQGVVKTVNGTEHMVNELIADRISFPADDADEATPDGV